MINRTTELLIVGLGQWAAIAAETAVAGGRRVGAFVAEDDRIPSPNEEFLGSPVTTFAGSSASSIPAGDPLFVAIGDNQSRARLLRRLAEAGATVASLVHPFSAVGTRARIGVGVLISPGATIDPEVVLGDGVIIGPRALVCHESQIGPFCRIDAQAVIGGRCEIGEGSTIGSGAVVISNVRVGRGVTIEPRTVVTKNIPDHVVVGGVPARLAHGAMPRH